MPANPPNRQRNLAEADQAAQKNFANEELSSPVQQCPARHPQIFVVPSRYAMAQELGNHAALKPAAPTQSHPMALRRLRPGYLYLWHVAGPLKRYAVADNGGLLEQQADQPHATFETGEQVGIALNKSSDAWMLYSEMPWANRPASAWSSRQPSAMHACSGSASPRLPCTCRPDIAHPLIRPRNWWPS